ncbi:MAG: hypothetical protein M5U34_27085 [Chloroflexi bacterium]|nr:hypothetical protein [Chloroflexota bacterium]
MTIVHALVLPLPHQYTIGNLSLTIAGAGENDNASGDLDILAAMIISGTGDSNTVIDGNATDRVFDVISNTVIFDGLRIANGDAASEKGGGIIVQSGTAVTVTNSTFISNTGDYGGGIYNAGSLTVDNSRFYQNFASDIGGGGICNVGELTVNATDVSGNSTLGDGGGIASSGGTAYIHSTSVANNQAEFDSGGFMVLSIQLLSLSLALFLTITPTDGVVGFFLMMALS